MLDAVGDELEAVVLVHQRAQPTSDDVLELGNYDAYWDTVGHPADAREHIGRGGERVTAVSPLSDPARHRREWVARLSPFFRADLTR